MKPSKNLTHLTKPTVSIGCQSVDIICDHTELRENYIYIIYSVETSRQEKLTAFTKLCNIVESKDNLDEIKKIQNNLGFKVIEFTHLSQHQFYDTLPYLVENLGEFPWLKNLKIKPAQEVIATYTYPLSTLKNLIKNTLSHPSLVKLTINFFFGANELEINQSKELYASLRSHLIYFKTDLQNHDNESLNSSYINKTALSNIVDNSCGKNYYLNGTSLIDLRKVSIILSNIECLLENEYIDDDSSKEKLYNHQYFLKNLVNERFLNVNRICNSKLPIPKAGYETTTGIWSIPIELLSLYVFNRIDPSQILKKINIDQGKKPSDINLINKSSGCIVS